MKNDAARRTADGERQGRERFERLTPAATARPAWLGRLGCYGLALLVVPTGVAVRTLLTRLVGLGLPTYVSFYPLVMLVALIGGWGPGLLAILAAAVAADYWLLPPQGMFKVESSVDLVGLAFFCTMGLLVSAVAEICRRTRGHLEELVVVRTAALSQANEQLQAQAEELQAQTEKLTTVNRELHASEEKYRSIVETATEGIVLVDAQARIVFVNDRWSEIFGYSREEAMHMTHFELAFPEDAATMEKRWESRKDGRRETYEIRLRRKDGSPVWVLVGVAPTFGPDGEFLGTLTVLADITKSKRAEEALRENEERFRILMTNLSSGVALITEDGKFTLYNPAFLTMFGLAEDSCIRNVNDQNWGDWQVFEEDGTLLPLDDHPVRKAALTGQAVRNKLVGVRLPSGGALRWMLVSAEPIPRAGQRRAIICTYHDVSERKAAEEALRELNATLESKVAQRTEELEHRARQLQKLTLELTEAEERERARIAQILHDDLQQVLAAAKFQVGLVGRRVKNNAEVRETVGQARNLLVEAIAKSRCLSHELSSPALAQTNLCAAFEQLARQMRAEHGLTVHLEMEARLDVASEPLRLLLYKAAQEMLFNVIKHAEVAEARLRLRRQRGRLRLSVSDRGRGFDPAGPACKIGFGLLSVRERIELLGGRLTIRSAPGKGSTFFVAIPDSEASKRLHRPSVPGPE
jgi:two-component system CheB/CheR fusion protein